MAALRSFSRRPRCRAAGFTTPEALVGAALALVVIAAALTITRGMLTIARELSIISSDAVSIRWALDRISREAGRAGLGVDPLADPDCPDETIEFLDPSAVAFRSDLDGDDPSRAFEPEQNLTGRFPVVPTGNDEVVVFLRRTASGGGPGRALFSADLDSNDRFTAADGTLIARRDGDVEAIDAGPFARPSYAGRGTLYRVTFVHNAAKFGGGRFRVVQPLLDGVTRFEIQASTRDGTPVVACGGEDLPDDVACRSSIERLAVTIGVGEADPLTREILLPRHIGSDWADE